MVVSQLREALTLIGIESSSVCLHTSIRAFSPRISPRDLIDTLLSTGTTLLAPAFTYDYETAPPAGDRPGQNGMSYVHLNSEAQTRGIFSPAENSLSVEDMGALPQALLETPGRARGNHPLNSFVSVGPSAQDLVSGQSPLDVYAPFAQLIKANGKILLIGTDTTSLTLVHYAEMLSGRQLFVRWARDSNGKVIRTRVGSCSAGFGKLMPILMANSRTITWQGARLIAADVVKLVAALQRAIEANPGITSCGRDNCLRCTHALKGGPQS